jgi:hypothetical protein
MAYTALGDEIHAAEDFEIGVALGINSAPLQQEIDRVRSQ